MFFMWITSTRCNGQLGTHCAFRLLWTWFSRKSGHFLICTQSCRVHVVYTGLGHMHLFSFSFLQFYLFPLPHRVCVRRIHLPRRPHHCVLCCLHECHLSSCIPHTVHRITLSSPLYTSVLRLRVPHALSTLSLYLLLGIRVLFDSLHPTRTRSYCFNHLLLSLSPILSG